MLDAELCYRALLSRDARFDGRFFTGVLSTGIYCRPICPARTPRIGNVRFFECAAAAEAAGLRPCRRCRPDAAPGTPAWLGTPAVVSRALREIENGALDRHGVDHLAGRAGMGARQLRRLFQKHLGVSPHGIARTRQVHFARALIDQTDIPITQVGLAAGFSSIRQFNHAIRRTFGRSPSELRAGRRTAGTPAGAVVMRLPYRPPLDWPTLLRFFASRAIPGVEAVEGGAYRRTVEVDGSAGSIEVSPEPGRPRLVVHVLLPSSRGLLDVARRVRRLFDLDADPLQVTSHLRHCSMLGPVCPGLRVPGAWDGFELAVRAVLGQQVTVAGATALAGRLVDALGGPVACPTPGLRRLFPTAQAVAGADLSRVGLTAARAAAVRALARAVCSGEVDFGRTAGLDETVALLTALPGIGPWTAHYVAMRAFGEPDAFPAMDLGLRRALANGAGFLRPAHSERWQKRGGRGVRTRRCTCGPTPAPAKQL
jgi:AraC family transcriptional regulator, regulatory protein of adaptative response / DNA-3-methyladenine glycosylase II